MVLAFELCPILFGVPETRLRLWMVCFPRRLGFEPDDDARRYLQTSMQKLVGIKMSPLESYLLSDHDRLIATINEKILADKFLGEDDICGSIMQSGGLFPTPPKKKPKHSDNRVFKWVQEHDACLQKIGKVR